MREPGTERAEPGWLVTTAVVIGVGPWGAIAGLLLGLSFAAALGAPRDVSSWAMWAGLVGLLAGFPAGAWAGMQLVRRAPRVLGAVAVVWAALVVVATVAGNAEGDDLGEALLIFGPGAAVTVALVVSRRRRPRAVPVAGRS